MNFSFYEWLRGCAIVVFAILFLACKEDKKSNLQQEAHKFTNELVNETSPYLLQHAHNPVNWKPWSSKALEDAEAQHKLVLISIGYSSCHWCHVMEEETFEDEAVAKLMNENFINIKVDREERPDIDQIYQTFAQLTESNSGWPLNVITLPNGKPLYGGTYHTKEQWIGVLNKINDLYKNDAQKAAEYSDMVAGGIAEANAIAPAADIGVLTQQNLKESVANWKGNWDLERGGDKGVQKFMIPSNLSFLIDYAVLEGDNRAMGHVKTTLDKIEMGGVYDQLGGGFYRYSTDADWKIPHFEKMLYDNAQALSLYSKAYSVFKSVEYKNVVWETIAFLEREMKNPEGGYYAALDADSDGEEGKFYVWKESELKSVLGDDYDLFAIYYNIGPNSIWEEGNHVLRLETDIKSFLDAQAISYSDFDAAKNRWHKKLLNARDKRVRPSTDDKIITSWNALLITGLVDAYKAFGQQRHLDMAQGIYQFLKTTSFKNGLLVHTYKKGSVHKEGFVEDYAFLAEASLALYEVTLDGQYLEFAQEMVRNVASKFEDEASGMYRYNAASELIAKIIKTDDGVLPSPNAVMAHNLFRLGHIEYNMDYLKKSKQMLSAMVPSTIEAPASYSKWNALYLNIAYPFFEVAVVGNNAFPFVKDLHQKHLPNTLVVGTETESNLPLFEDRYDDDATYVYVCQNTTCKLPVRTVEEAMRQLQNF
ncbi:thioredoxin domain-containing protein [Pareuzebyella sediminis]|uniref:thioredoxin domain-containing protein n=1 Tax=Pareuzebyella sediminis TaxID=2607998 RepID=UPI0011EFD61A|nr:thioredoxin domain-containing protein [Pareuzebyella sediminis]